MRIQLTGLLVTIARPRRALVRPLAGLLALFVAGASVPPPARAACDGLPPDAAEQAAAGGFRDTTHAFIGTVVFVDGDVARFRVDAWLRGDSLPAELDVRDHQSTEIDVGFTIGRSYLVAAVRSNDGRLITSACKGTREVRSPEDRNHLVAMAEDPNPPVTATGGLPWIAMILVGLIAILTAWYAFTAADRRGKRVAISSADRHPPVG